MTKRICVVGAGLAGGIVASQLAGQGRQVVLVELGSKPQPYESDSELWEEDRPKAAFTRGIGLGGTSNFWHGGLTVMDRSDVEGVSEHFGGAKIPMPYADLLRYYRRAVDHVRGTTDFTVDDILAPPREQRVRHQCRLFPAAGPAVPEEGVHDAGDDRAGQEARRT